MGCKDAVLPKPLSKNRTINCLTFEENMRKRYNDNLCLFQAHALHLHGNQRLEEETSKNINSFINGMDRLSPNQFKGVHMNTFPVVEDVLTFTILLSHLDFVDGNNIGEFARRGVQKYKNTVRLLRYDNHISYVRNINVAFQFFRCPNFDAFCEKRHSIWSEI